MADAAVEPSPEQAPAQEVLGESIAKRKQSVSSVDSHQTKNGHREPPVSPRRNGLPPKRTTATTKRPLSSAPTPATKPTAASKSRTATSNGLSKPPTRPTPGTAPRRPAHAVNAATAASTGHKSKPSTSSIEDKPKPRSRSDSGSTDKSKKPVTNGTAKRVSIAPNTPLRAPATKSGLPPTTTRVSIGPSTTSEKKPTTSRSTISGPTKPAVKPSTNSTVRPTTASNTARTARPTDSSKTTGKDGPVAEAAKKRLSAIHPSPAPIQKPSSDSTSALPRRPGLPTRQSTLSVTIQQRLREMQMVHQMLSAAMAEDDSGNDEDKQEAARQADEGIAMLKAKLEEARAEETENGQAASDGEVNQGTGRNEPKAAGDDSLEIPDRGKEHQDEYVAQLKDQLKKREASISELEADLQAELLESSRVRHSIPKKIEEATEILRQEHKSELDDLNSKHQAELDALRTKLEEMQANHEEHKSELDHLNHKHQAELDALRTKLEESQANHRELVEQSTKDLEEARKLAKEEAQKEAAKNSEQDEADHTKTLQSLEERLAHEQGQSSSLKSELEAAQAASEDKTSAHEEAMNAKDKELGNMSEKLRVLEQINADHAEELQHEKERTEALERQLEDMQNSTSAAADAAKEEAAALAHSLEETRKAAEAEAQENKKLSEESQQALKSATNEIEALKKALETFSEERQAKDEQHTASLKDLKSEVDAASTSLEQSTQELESATHKHNKEMQDLRDQHAAEKRAIEDSADHRHQTAVDEARAKYDALQDTLETARKEHASELEALKAGYREMADIQASLTKEMAEMETEHAKELEDMARDLKSEHTKGMKDAEAAAAKRLAEAEERHTGDLEKLVNEHEETYSRLRKELEEALENTERLKAQHEEVAKELEMTKANAAREEPSEVERAPNSDAEVRTQIGELQSAVEAADKENSTLQEKLQKAEDTAERHALKLRELEAAYKVTSAELTEIQTKRATGTDYCASPTPKSGLPLSKWADTSDVGNTDGKEGEELGSSIEGTMAGLREQVRQLEEVNEDMLEETTRIVKMLSDVPQGKASRGKSSGDES